jgi:hypothetical protein
MDDNIIRNIDRENILNNPLAVSAIKDSLDIRGVNFDGQFLLTSKQIADFFDVDERTVRRFVENHREELVDNGYSVLSGETLKNFRNHVKDIDVLHVSPSRELSVFNFRAFLNFGMLLTTSDKAKELRSLILNIVVKAVNAKAGGNTKYINQRDENYIIAAYYNEGYNKAFIKSLKEYVNAGNTKYPNYTDKIYKTIFGENTSEYKKILDLAKNDKARETMYSEVLTAISSLEAGVADYIREKYLEHNRKLSREEVDEIFDEISSFPTMKPMMEMARVKMASLDRGLRNIEHPTLGDYVLPLDSADFERFLGQKSKELSNRIDDNIEVFKRLKDK